VKPSWEWDEGSIRELIASQVQESLTLDYKASDALAKTDPKKREISKDVSAFANSAGGTIVYGVLEDKHVPTKIDAGCLPTDISKEWLEHVIQGNIQRRIDGVRINPILLTGPAAGRVLYVVSIPQSMRAPHMAADHRFYKRFNFESVQMEEYEVRDAGRRNESPDLTLDIKWLTAPQVSAVELLLTISNEAPEPAHHVTIRLYIDARATILHSGGWQHSLHQLSTPDNVSIPVRVLHMNWSVAAKLPIWEGEVFRVNDEKLLVELPATAGAYTFGWRLSSPRMAPKQRYYSVESNGRSINIVEHPSSQ
jgi:hypothetical protein